MIAQIIPLKKIPKHLDFFDYKIPPSLLGQIKPGGMVKIPWRWQTIFGLVKNISPKPTKDNLNLREIISLAHPKPLASPGQIKLMESLAANFYLAPSLWWKMILPKIPGKKTRFKPWLTKDKLGKNKLPATIPPSVRAGKKEELQLIMPDTFADMVFWAVKLAKTKGTNLLLCPEIYHLELILSYLPKSLLKKIAVFHKQQSKTEYWQNYLKVINNQASLIIGSRLASLAPFTKLSQITVFKSEDYSFKQADQNPRFWIHDVVYNLQKIYNCQLTFLSMAPRISNYAYLKNQRGHILNQQQPGQIQVVDLAKEFQINNYSYISWQLEQSINQALAAKQKVFLLVNRKGIARRLICRDCGWIARCQTCQRLLTVKDINKLYCSWCGQSESILTKCENCAGVNLTNQGLTNQSIYNQTKKIWPKVRSQFIDLEHPKLHKNAQLIVGTQFAIRLLASSKLGLVALVNADQEIISADYHGGEYGWQLFNYLARINKHLSVVLQTWQPDYYVYRYLKSGNYEKFWQREMNLRKKYQYPPYSKFIKCIISDANQLVAKNKAIDLYKHLHKSLPLSVKLNPPFPTLGVKINNRFAFFLLIKYTRENLNQYLADLPADIILDFDPYSMF